MAKQEKLFSQHYLQRVQPVPSLKMCKVRLTFTIQTILNASRITGATLALGITARGVLIADIQC